MRERRQAVWLYTLINETDVTTKHTKSTKEENIFFDWCLLHYPIFVSFATFVVQNSFVE